MAVRIAVTRRQTGWDLGGWLIIGVIVAWVTGNLEFDSGVNILRSVIAIILWPIEGLGSLFGWLSHVIGLETSAAYPPDGIKV